MCLNICEEILFLQNILMLICFLGLIIVENIRVYAYHGCLAEETVVGSKYRVDVKVRANLKNSSLTDSLEETVDYVLLNKLVVEQMAIPAKLLEAVARRILNKIFESSSLVDWASVSVAKLNPPIGGDVEKVTVLLEQKRA